MSDMFRVTVTKPLGFSVFLIHLFPWPWGSISSGQRLPRVTTTPFSVLNASAGSSLMFQSRTSEGSARKSAKSNSSDAGISSFFTSGSHVCLTKASR